MTVLATPAPGHAYQINETERGKPIRWGVDQVVLRVDPEYGSTLPEGQAASALNMAFDAWRGFPGVPELLIKDEDPGELGHRGNSPTNGIYRVEDWPYEPDKLAVTVVTYELDSGRLLDADVLVNAHVPFTLYATDEDLAEAQAYDLAAVLTHEAGHMLGLGETDADPMATMWPYARMGDTHQRTLHEDDEEGILAAYSGAPPLPAGGCGGMTVAGRTGGAPLLWQVGLALLLLAVAHRRLRQGGARRISVVAGMGVLLGGGLPAQPTADANPGAVGVNGIYAAHVDEVMAIDDPRAQRFATALMADDAAPRLGLITSTAVRREGGLLYTDYALRHHDGSLSTLTVPGGTLDGIGQRASDMELPSEGQELMVALPSDGTQRWAYHKDGELSGGWLAHGVRLRTAP